MVLHQQPFKQSNSKLRASKHLSVSKKEEIFISSQNVWQKISSYLNNARVDLRFQRNMRGKTVKHMHRSKSMKIKTCYGWMKSRKFFFLVNDIFNLRRIFSLYFILLSSFCVCFSYRITFDCWMFIQMKQIIITFSVVQYWRTERKKKLQKQKNSVRSLFFLNCFVMGGLSYKSEKEIFFATEISNERREKILFSPHTNSSISLLCLIFMYYEWIFWRILLWSAQIMYHSSYIHQLFITDKKKKKRKIVVEIMNFTWIEGCLTNHFRQKITNNRIISIPYNSRKEEKIVLTEKIVTYDLSKSVFFFVFSVFPQRFDMTWRFCRH